VRVAMRPCVKHLAVQSYAPPRMDVILFVCIAGLVSLRQRVSAEWLSGRITRRTRTISAPLFWAVRRVLLV
jgi:hypothetical protein